MSTEDKLKNYILTKYRSIREFTNEIDLPYSTMATILKNGVLNAGVHNIIKICHALNISADALAEGKILSVSSKEIDHVSVESVIESAKFSLLNANSLTLANQPLTDAQIRSLIISLDMVLESEKKRMMTNE